LSRVNSPNLNIITSPWPVLTQRRSGAPEVLSRLTFRPVQGARRRASASLARAWIHAWCGAHTVQTDRAQARPRRSWSSKSAAASTEAMVGAQAEVWERAKVRRACRGGPARASARRLPHSYLARGPGRGPPTAQRRSAARRASRTSRADSCRRPRSAGGLRDTGIRRRPPRIGVGRMRIPLGGGGGGKCLAPSGGCVRRPRCGRPW
jgi:hypothetical protein